MRRPPFLLPSALLLALGLSTQAASTLAVCTDAAPESFDIVQTELAASNDAAGMTVFDQLLRFKPGTTELMPSLASNWEISKDGLQYTLHLRRGVKFHTTPWFTPSRDMNADDVLFSINRLYDPKHPAHAVAKSGYAYWSGMEMSKLIKAVSKVDDYTVRFVLNHPEAPFLSDLAMSPIGSVYSAEYGTQLIQRGQLEQLSSQPVGTGPFVFKRYQQNELIRYAANTSYWDGAPKVDNLVFAITVNDDTRAQKVKAGECQVALLLKPTAVETFKGDPKTRVLQSTPLATAFLAINTQHRVLKDQRMREALSIAIDKDTYLQVIRGGMGKAAANFLPPSIWSHDASLKNRLDRERARQLAKAAGYDGSTLHLFVDNSGISARAGELLQGDWAKAGIKVEVEVMELSTMFKRGGKGEHDLMLMSWYGDNGDPDNFFTPNLSCSSVGNSNKAQWCDQPFEDLITAARRSNDLKQRTALYQQAQRRVYDQVPVIPLTYSVVINAVSKRVNGYVPSPLNVSDFRRVSLN
ncbi:ABC transporter substrate-binding protein [Chitinimonas sp.]|uniref:ABC transporter substrate-binding protein n=1 Tax=Chitinimonas sp. TaxID=1934313 RepID=UPI002F9572EB